METEERKKLLSFALQALNKCKNPRSYALNDDSKDALAALAAAVFEQRKAAGRTPMDQPTAQPEMIALIEKVAAAGVNLFQQRGEEKQLPKLWVNPLTNEPLRMPKTPDERAVLARLDPELLELLDELEVRPYATTRKLREREAYHEALKSIPYGSTEHAVNPFRFKNETDKARFIKNAGSPELIEFVKGESLDVSIPIFGRQKNMTIEGRLMKEPATAATVKIAQQIHSSWMSQDRIQATEQRAAAEAQLKKLEVVA
jgi:hypothetical protein